MKYIEKMMKIIQDQFLEVMSSDRDFYSRYQIELSNEQQYLKDKKREPNKIYIVVKFMPGSINFGQNIIPVNFNALGEGNKLDVCQRLLLEYAQRYNLGDPINISKTESGDNNNYIIKQVYTQPQVLSNFNSTWNEFRSLFFMSGTFLIGKNSIPIKEITYFANETDEEGTVIDFINTAWEFSIQLDSQAFYGTDSRTTSKSKIGTLSLSIASYFVDNPLCNKILGIAFNDKTLAANGIKEKFYLTIKFANGVTVTKMQFSLANAASQQNIGEFPMISMAFTN